MTGRLLNLRLRKYAIAWRNWNDENHDNAILDLEITRDKMSINYNLVIVNKNEYVGSDPKVSMAKKHAIEVQ